MHTLSRSIHRTFSLTSSKYILQGFCPQLELSTTSSVGGQINLVRPNPGSGGYGYWQAGLAQTEDMLARLQKASISRIFIDGIQCDDIDFDVKSLVVSEMKTENKVTLLQLSPNMISLRRKELAVQQEVQQQLNAILVTMSGLSLPQCERVKSLLQSIKITQ